jgi:hypothetical protein
MEWSNGIDFQNLDSLVFHAKGTGVVRPVLVTQDILSTGSWDYYTFPGLNLTGNWQRYAFSPDQLTIQSQEPETQGYQWL